MNMANAGKGLLSIIIVNRNGREVIKDCLTSIHDTVTTPHEVIMVDNNSSDGSADFVEREFPDTIVLRQTRNLGFSKGNNVGCERSVGGYILFLNPDVIVLRNAVDTMVNYVAVHKEIGILGPKMLEINGKISRNGKRRLPTPSQDLLDLFLLHRIAEIVRAMLSKIGPLGRIFSYQYEKSGRCECISGSCMMLKKADFESLGGFDETVPMYLDDIDLCFRSLKSGKLNYYLADAAIVHIGQASTRKTKNYKLYDVLCMRARMIYYRKNFGKIRQVSYACILLLSVPYLLLLDLLAAPYYLFSGNMTDYKLIVKKHLMYVDVVLDRPVERILE